MISFEEAFRTVTDSAFKTGSEMIPVTASLGRVLAADIVSDTDLPPFNRAAVDGYACRKADLDRDLEVIEVIPAGKEPGRPVLAGQCARIMTGAIVPDGCDIVVMVEETVELPSGKVAYRGRSIKPNFSVQGEDVRKGEVVIRKGRIIEPQDIAVMISCGSHEVIASRRPSAGIISTGDELVEPGVPPRRSQIRNSNSYQLMAQVERAGALSRYYGIVPDTGDSALKVIKDAIAENDIVILTGGVSMGDFDFVPSFLEQAGVKIIFDRVNVQPGKPTTFGVHPKAIVFGLPGNPVSSFIQFETLVRPVMHRMMSSDWKPEERKYTLGARIERRSADRKGWIPVSIRENEAFGTDYHGSAHIAALTMADGIIVMEPGEVYLEKGNTVTVRTFR